MTQQSRRSETGALDGRAPMALFEVSWEVCNKVGGIYTVVSTKAREASKKFGKNYFLLGPEREVNPDFEECPATGSEDSRQWETFRRAAAIHNLKCRFGRWNIPGHPKVILVDWKDRYNQNQLLYDLWRDFGVDSLTGGWDYVEPVMFSTACGEAIATFAKILADENEGEISTVAHFHEWMCGAGLLHLKRNAPSIATIFTTHATMLGRSLAGSGRDIYAEMDQLNAAQEAQKCNITAKFSMESVSAREADCFTTVSDLTAHEAAAFLGRRPDLVTPNGLSLDTIPDYSFDRTVPEAGRKKILAAAGHLLRRELPENTSILLISGRYEFHNKGIDLFLDALAQLNRTHAANQKPILALCSVMGGHTGINPAAMDGNPDTKPNHQGNWITAHRIYDSEHDPILTSCVRLGLDNRPENVVQVIFDPAQLDGNDGFLNMTYEEMLASCDMGIFPSWYEPWGYTPQEAAANSVPTVTSDLAGFGQWVRNCSGNSHSASIIERARVSYDESVSKLCALMAKVTALSENEMTALRKAGRAAAQLSDWKIFFKNYVDAYNLAAENAASRFSTRPMSSVDDENLTRVFNGTPSATPLLHGFTSTARMPEKLARLGELAHNLWWTWHPEFEDLFRSVDPVFWDKIGHNAVELLEKMDHRRFIELAEEPRYVELYEKAMAAFDADMNAPFEDSIPELTESRPIAYFSTEYGIHESMPIYSGGLGVLSGDHLKSASDLRLPLVGVGLLYKCGYFQQQITAEGYQTALYPENNFRMLPLTRVKDKATGDHLYISVELPGRTLYARVWRLQVGRIPLYLLDTDMPRNTEEDRRVTERLYVADRDTRIRQEILLGMGGVKMLAALGLRPRAYHMNEGHSAFMILERIHHLCLSGGLSFEAAREVVRGDSIFTTHTPVDAGNERFSGGLMHRYFDSWCKQLGLSWDVLMDMGRRDRSGTDFEMTLLALNHAVRSNGVSRLHGSVSRAMWQFNWKGVPTEEIPIGYITNGVHLSSFTGRSIVGLLEQSVGDNWNFLPTSAPQWQNVESLPDEDVWNAKQEQKKVLFDLLSKTSPRVFQNAASSWKQQPLVIGFARRFAPYKRATLLLADTQRLIKILANEDRPVIFVFSGKSHPADTQGNDLIKSIVTASRSAELGGKIFFIPNYNLDIARAMVQGCDIWMNTPRRPYEASGTSGQKAAPNGTLNLSISDGWWCEGDNGCNGWTIGPRVTSIHDTPKEQSDYADAESFYSLLEDEVVPLYFDRGADGLPHGWIERMKNSIATLTPEYNSARMVSQYFDECYRPAAVRHVKLRADSRLIPRRLSEWKSGVAARFSSLRIDQIQLQGLKQNAVACNDPLAITAWVVPGGMKPEELELQFVAGRSEQRDFVDKPEVVTLKFTGTDEQARLIYTGVYAPSNNGHYLYGIRALPCSPDLDGPFDTHLIQWG